MFIVPDPEDILPAISPLITTHLHYIKKIENFGGQLDENLYWV